MDLETLKVIKEWLQPSSIKSLRGFLGLTGHYRKFIKHYGLITKTLTNLLKKKALSWNEQATEAYKKLKHCLMNPPILCMPDFNKEFFIECDASGVELVLCSLNMGDPLLILVMNGRNLLLSTYEKELLALLLATKKEMDPVAHKKKIYYKNRPSKSWTLLISKTHNWNTRKMVSRVAWF